MTRVVMFSFWGREPNIHLQLPFIRRILEEHPEVEFHGFNLARERSDYFYLSHFPSEPRLKIHHEFSNTRPNWNGYKAVWTYLASPEFQDAVLVKADDDVVFFQTERFGKFVDAAKANPGTVISADVQNNGACSVHQSGLHERFQATGIRLLDWHCHALTAQMAHQHFFEHGEQILAQPVTLIPTDEWLSINVIALDHPTVVKLADLIGTPPPPVIAGRPWRPDRDQVGDEGAVNMLPRAILHGFTAAHLSFGPQNIHVTDMAAWRDAYRRIGDAYLNGGTWPPATPAQPIYLPPRRTNVARYEIVLPCRYADADGIPVFHDTVGSIVELDQTVARMLGHRVKLIIPPPEPAPAPRPPRPPELFVEREPEPKSA